jgi:DNA polymerase-1
MRENICMFQEEFEPTSQPTRFLLIDGHALIYRAYHAYPDLTDAQGQLINAVYGFARILLTVIRDQEPEYLAVAFDHKSPTFRHESYTEYKAHREAMPDDLIPQIGMIKDVVTALNLPQFELAGYEADDLVGTLTAQAQQVNSGLNLQTIVVTGDKDLLQLVDEKTRVFIPGRGNFSRDTLYDTDKVKEKMGVYPLQVPDLKGLMGDSSDNIPGVRGIGPKTAQILITHFDSVDKLYEILSNHTEDQLLSQFANKGLTKKVIAKLQEDKANALMSKELATINRTAPIALDLAACTIKQYDKEKVMALFEELGFKSLIGLLPDDSFEEALQTALF